jgi:hypothetical protein
MISIPEFHWLLGRAKGDGDLAERILVVLDLAFTKLGTLARNGITVS